MVNTLEACTMNWKIDKVRYSSPSIWTNVWYMVDA